MSLHEQDTLSSAQYWFNPRSQQKPPSMTEKLLNGAYSINRNKLLMVSLTIYTLKVIFSPHEQMIRVINTRNSQLVQDLPSLVC